MLHLKFIIRQSQGSECRKHLVYWHRSLDSFWHCRGWCAPAVHQQTHLYCLAHRGPHYHLHYRVFFTRQHGSQSSSWHVSSCSFTPLWVQLRLCVCWRKELLVKTVTKKSPTLCHTEILGQVIVMCEHCHVQHYKWLTYSSTKSNSQSNLLYLKLLVFFDCCWPEEAH